MSNDTYVVVAGSIFNCNKAKCEPIAYWNERVAFEYYLRSTFHDDLDIVGKAKELAIKHTNMMFYGARYSKDDEDIIMRLRCIKYPTNQIW
jgi:hypothetical protein